MPKATTSPKSFCATAFEWKAAKPEWLDTAGFVELSDRRLARVELDGSCTHYEFNAFRVTILSKLTGTIDVKRFEFCDYLNIKQRIDTRSDYIAHGFRTCNETRSDGTRGQGWYIAVPKTTRPLCAAIERYIDLYR